VAKVERLCLLIQRMDKQSADADMPGRCHRADDRIFQQAGADAAAMPALINSQTAQNSHGHGFRHLAGLRLEILPAIKKALLHTVYNTARSRRASAGATIRAAAAGHTFRRTRAQNESASYEKRTAGQVCAVAGCNLSIYQCEAIKPEKLLNRFAESGYFEKINFY
jgi:hypothetical protein